MPDPLVTLAEFKRHVRVTTDEQDDDLTLKRNAAQSIVLTRIQMGRDDDEDWLAEIDAWTEETVPDGVKAAILVQGEELYRFRGGLEPPKRDHGRLSPQVESYLSAYIDPAVA